MKNIFYLFLFFSLSFYGILSFFYGNLYSISVKTPLFLMILREVVFVVFLIYVLIKFLIKKDCFVSGKYYLFVLKMCLLFYIIYLFLIFYHFFTMEIIDVIQHEIRNLIFYSLILFGLPIIFTKKKDIDIFWKILLKIGLFFSVLVIIKRMFGWNIFWYGRAVGWMDNPSNFGVFLALPTFWVISVWRKLDFKKYFYLMLLSIALILTSSVTALLFVIFGVFVIVNLGKFNFFERIIISFLIFVFYLYTPLLVDGVYKCFEYKIGFKEAVKKECNVGLYITDKINRISKGFYKKSLLFDSSDKRITSINTYDARKQQYVNFLSLFEEEKLSVSDHPSKDFETKNHKKRYKRFDSQYLNFFYNSGLLSIFLFLTFFGYAIFTSFFSWFKYKDITFLICGVYLLSMVTVGWLSVAFLNRYPINLWTYLCMGLVFLKKDMLCRNN